MLDEIDGNIAVIATIIYAFFMVLIWYVPGAMDMPVYPLWIKITAAVVLLPVSYFITLKVSER